MKEIEIGIGIGKLKFGMKPEEVISIIGEPNEKKKVAFSDEDPGFFSEEWHYDDKDMSLEFDMMDTLELSTISVSSEQYTLNGKVLFGLEREQVMAEIEKMDINQDWTELVEDEPSNTTITNEEDGISLYFEDGLLAEFQWEIL
jgi:hypothetical protein